MISALILAIGLSVSAECVKTVRDEPTVMITQGSKKHFIHMFEWEEAKCKVWATKFNAGIIQTVCGCKRIKDPGERDRIRLRCANTGKDGKVWSKTAMIFYYFDDDISIKECIRTRNILMKRK